VGMPKKGRICQKLLHAYVKVWRRNMDIQNTSEMILLRNMEGNTTRVNKK
jgi:hypothetical protein